MTFNTCIMTFDTDCHRICFVGWKTDVMLWDLVNVMNLSFVGQGPGACFTNILRALQNDLVKIYNDRNHNYDNYFKLKLCMCAQSMALVTHTKFHIEIHIKSTIFAIQKFRENILESTRNLGVEPPWCCQIHPERADLKLIIIILVNACNLLLEKKKKKKKIFYMLHKGWIKCLQAYCSCFVHFT